MDLFGQESIVRQRDVFSVTRLNREVRSLLEGNFSLIWLEGRNFQFFRPQFWALVFFCERQ